MPGLILVILIIGYTGFVIYRKTKDIKAGKSCCSGCSSCQAKDKCGKPQTKEEDRDKQ
jgi:positive regulator of sigma E activity